MDDYMERAKVYLMRQQGAGEQEMVAFVVYDLCGSGRIA